MDCVVPTDIPTYDDDTDLVPVEDVRTVCAKLIQQGEADENRILVSDLLDLLFE